ncbi:MAG: hypothetical protein PHX14_11910 [Syntrophomonadaceae bacterium]|nr:hypothetical protein [Syntrophomonadaceae bacterium]
MACFTALLSLHWLVNPGLVNAANTTGTEPSTITVTVDENDPITTTDSITINEMQNSLSHIEVLTPDDIQTPAKTNDAINANIEQAANTRNITEISVSNPVSLILSSNSSLPGNSVTASGQAEPITTISIKIVDSAGAIVFFGTVKTDASGSYSKEFIIPDVPEGVLNVVAGVGDNTSCQLLTIGTPATQVTLTLNTGSAAPGETITASGTADPNTWVAIKIVDTIGNIVYFQGTKSGADGNYAISFNIPQVNEGNLTVVAGLGTNVVSQNLLVSAGVDECFIATAAFGSKFEPSVALLRSFRDKFLLTNTLGKAFVKFYYRNSPPIANYIAHNALLKAGVRGFLAPVVGVVYLLFHPVLMTLAVGLILLGFVVYRTRKRKPALDL